MCNIASSIAFFVKQIMYTIFCTRLGEKVRVTVEVAVTKLVVAEG